MAILEALARIVLAMATAMVVMLSPMALAAWLTYRRTKDYDIAALVGVAVAWLTVLVVGYFGWLD